MYKRQVYKEGDWISLDGSTGNIYGERLHTAEAEISGEFGRIMAWADQFRDLQVRTNADTPKDARQAANFGAEGIGLCRTEHMFFDPDRIAAIRQMAGADWPVIRIMPNTPASIGEGMILYCAEGATEEEVSAFTGLMQGAGSLDPLPEGLIDAGSAVSCLLYTSRCV